MKSNKEIASLFSGGKFEEVFDYLSEAVEWNIFEEKMCINGKHDVIKFCRSVAEYFKSVVTKFELSGSVVDADKVAIYGNAEFIRESKTINVVHSCDVYEFGMEGQILKIYSYCNSQHAAG